MSFRKTRITKPDGRYLWYYTWDSMPDVVKGLEAAPAATGDGHELRWHPLLEEWVVVAPERQDRTFLPPPEYCPLCPTRDASTPTEVPSRHYELVVFENRFPALRRKPPASSRVRAPFRSARSAGACEVVLYSPKHESTFGEMPVDQIERLIDVWADRYRELGARREVAYVFIFENRGEEIGVTLTHPHGQIYAFPYIPPHVGRELAASARYRRQHKSCLHCDLLAAESRRKERLVVQDGAFVAFVPYFARYPYEVHVVSRAHRRAIDELSAEERRSFASVLKTVLLKYDNLWGFPLPFTMSMHQRPTDGRRHPGCHFHVEFAPRQRSPDKLKYLAGCETGAGTFLNDVRPEHAAQELRWAKPRT